MGEPANPGFRHPTPPEIEVMLDGDAAFAEKWQTLTPLACNEWICWSSSAKRNATRQARRLRLQEEVLAGKKRPCCWPGCPHRRESARKWVDA